jgi:Family of unknown function (DUF6029)
MRPGPSGSERPRATLARLARRARTPGVALWALGWGATTVLSPERVARADGLSLSVTETTIGVQHSAARGNEELDDSGWGEWVNHLDALLRGEQWTAGLRLDSAVYWSRPVDFTPDSARFHDAVYPAKLWLTYSAPGLEITAGDSYVQFGRGLTLSMRKIDELGIDTTVRGVKVEMQRDPFAVTAVAGFANPSHIDDASGRSLFPTAEDPSQPVFGSDRLVGAEIEAGRGLPITLGTRAIRFSRCAPYGSDANGNAVTNFFSDPSGVAFGSCSAYDTSAWLSQLPLVPVSINDNDVTMVDQSIEVPSLGGHGKLYLEGATQYRHSDATPNSDSAGNALYASLSLDGGPLTTTLEVKSNRNFYPVAAAIDLTRAPEFNVITYSFVPPAETPTILDTEFGYFNACVNGGRLRADVRATDSLLVYGQGIFADTKTEQVSGQCDALGHVVSGLPAAQVEDRVWDGLWGFEWTFNGSLSHVFASTGVREDKEGTGDFYYRERHLEYSIVKYLGGPYSLELQGFHRLRWELGQNQRPVGVEQWWHEGDNYIAFKISPAWVFSQGFEYTTQTGYPAYYLNGSVIYKFVSGSNLRLFVGQQRAAFLCAAGVCRFFPAFEGARGELTLRF